MSKSIRLFYSTVTLSWGFTVRYKDVSASQPAYVIPPPTTVVGAFAYPLARLLGERDSLEKKLTHGRGTLISSFMEKAVDATIAASAGVVVDEPEIGIVVHSEISKISASIYKGSTEKDKIRAEVHSMEFYTEALPRIFPAQAVGSAYAPGVKLLLTWVVDVEKLLKKLSMNPGVKLKEEDIDSIGRLVSTGVSRIGSKEGIASTDPAESGYDREPVVRAGEEFETAQYVLASCVEPFMVTPTVELPYLDYELRRFYVPSVQASNAILLPFRKGETRRFKLKEPCKAYQPSREGMESFTSVGV